MIYLLVVVHPWISYFTFADSYGTINWTILLNSRVLRQKWETEMKTKRVKQ